VAMRIFASAPDRPIMRLLSRRAVNDDLTGPGGLEQSTPTVPGSPPFDAPEHLGGTAILACGALKDAAVGQLRR
jgi:hypothetical protein